MNVTAKIKRILRQQAITGNVAIEEVNDCVLITTKVKESTFAYQAGCNILTSIRKDFRVAKMTNTYVDDLRHRVTHYFCKSPIQSPLK